MIQPRDEYIAVTIPPDDFNRGVTAARKAGGIFDHHRDAWLIPASYPELAHGESFGWVFVEPAPVRLPSCPAPGAAALAEISSHPAVVTNDDRRTLPATLQGSVFAVVSLSATQVPADRMVFVGRYVDAILCLEPWYLCQAAAIADGIVQDCTAWGREGSPEWWAALGSRRLAAHLAANVWHARMVGRVNHEVVNQWAYTISAGSLDTAHRRIQRLLGDLDTGTIEPRVGLATKAAIVDLVAEHLHARAGADALARYLNMEIGI